MKAQHTLTIGGHTFDIRSEEDLDRIRQVEGLINERLEALNAADAPLQSQLLLATLNLARDLLEEQAAHRRLKEKIRSGSSDLLAKLDSVRFAA